MERERNLSENDRKIIRSNILVKSGGVITVVGAATIVEGVSNQLGAVNSLGLFIGGVGVSLILTGVRQRMR